MIHRLRYTAFLILIAISIKAQSIEVYASTDTSEYIVGDYIYYTLELNYTNDIKVELPAIIDSLKILDFIREETPVKQENDSGVHEIYKYVFSKYDSAAVLIPGYTINYYVGNETNTSSIKVNPVDILIRTIEVDQSGDIQDVKAPVKISLDWLFIGLIALAVILILTAAYFIFRRYRNKQDDGIKERKVIKIPPYRIALEALDLLDQKKLWQQGKIKDYHSEITQIIRRYFEDRFKVPALEITSEELLTGLEAKEGTGEITSITREFLSNADMVKFAKFQPMPSINEEMMKQAYSIVNTTKIEQDVEVETVEVQNAD